MAGQLFIVAAPSGTGKTSLVNALVESVAGVKVSVSHTTRAPRPQEVNGVSYHFVDDATFNDMKSKHEFLEHAVVYGNQYGTSAEWVAAQRQAGVDIILEIDCQGAEQIMRLCPEAQSVFIIPPSRAALTQRLRDRAQDSAEVITRRLSEAAREIEQASVFKYIIINDNFENALADFQAIIKACRCGLGQRTDQVTKLLAEFT
jgi:guanylate kinase